MKIALSNIFEGKIVTIIAGGPSLKKFDFSSVKTPIIAVNDSCYNVEADMIVAMDQSWHKAHKKFLDTFPNPIVTSMPSHYEKAIQIEIEKDCLLDFCINSAQLSGFLALALAFHLGASKVYLLGYDGGFLRTQSNHYKNKSNIGSKSYERANMWYDYFKKYPVINIGLDSLINSFTKVSLLAPYYYKEILNGKYIP